MASDGGHTTGCGDLTAAGNIYLHYVFDLWRISGDVATPQAMRQWSDTPMTVIGSTNGTMPGASV